MVALAVAAGAALFTAMLIYCDGPIGDRVRDESHLDADPKPTEP